MTMDVPATSIVDAGVVGASAEISAIVMRDLSWHVDESPEKETNIDLQMNWQIEHVRYAPTGLVYRVWADLSGATTEKPVFNCRIAHEAFFEVPADAIFSEEQMQAFGGLSVFPVIFPYVREALARLTIGGGLPPIFLAPLKLPFHSTLLAAVAETQEETESTLQPD
jgi:preprotein translocase subunit SecB